MLVDNAKALVTLHDAATREVTFNGRFLAFARYWGVRPRACAPYRARTKGKDERGVGYVKRNAIAGHRFGSWAAMEAHLAGWTREVADVRIHGTTGEAPLDRFARDEAATLRPRAAARASGRHRGLRAALDCEGRSAAAGAAAPAGRVREPARRGVVMADVLPDPLVTMLERLKLTALRDRIDNLLDDAGRQDMTLRECLALLLGSEIAHREERRMRMATGIAKFPFVRTLEGFDFAAQPSLDPGQVRDLAACRWVANGDALLVLGPPGVGKTHLAVGPRLCQRNGIERAFCSLKDFRRIATRYDKLARNFLAAVEIAAVILWWTE